MVRSAEDTLKAYFDAYAAKDADALASCLADDFYCGTLGGQMWAANRDMARAHMAGQIVDYPFELLELNGQIQLGNVIIRRETLVPADQSKPKGEMLGIYTCADGLIKTLHFAFEQGDEALSVAVAQGQLDAYNAQDLDAHAAFFTDDFAIANWGEADNLNGLDAYKERMAGVFGQFPENHAKLVSRLALGGHSIDQEDVIRGPDSPRFDVIVIYTLRDGKIARAEYVK